MIRWIRHNLGTAGWSETQDGIGYVRLDVRILTDSEGNSVETVLKVIETGLRILRGGECLVVVCHYGMSRRNAIAAGILALFENGSFQSALSSVSRATGEQQINAGVACVVEQAVNMLRGETEVRIRCIRDGVLVTGGNGFIGKRLVAAMRLSRRVIAPDRADLDIARDQLDLSLLLRRERIGRIVHLAFPKKTASNSSMAEGLLQLKNVLDAAQANDCPIIIPSSWVVYAGYRTSELLASEQTYPCPRDTYGQTRVLCESLVNLFRAKQGAPIHLLRLSPVYGPGSDRPAFLNASIDCARQGKPIVTHRYRNGEPRLDYLFVDDAVNALLALVNLEGASSEDFNVGGDQLISTREAALCIQSILGVNGATEYADMDDWVGNIQLDTAKFSKATGWRSATSFEEGIRRMVCFQRDLR